MKTDGPQLGIIHGIPDHEYHRGPGISNSGLFDIHRNPALYRLKRKHPPPQPEWAVVGQAFHCAVLEPDDFDNRFVMEPADAPKRPTQAQLNAKRPSVATLDAIAWWQEFDEEHEGKQILSTKPGKDPFWNPSQWCQVHRMRDAVMLNDLASLLVKPSAGPVEASIYWLDKDTDYGVRKPTGRLCKCRPDKINTDNNVAVDLKSTLDASINGFTKSAAEYRYFVQDAWYSSGYYQATGQTWSDFLFIAVEKVPPFGVRVHRFDQTARQAGRAQMLQDLDTYDRCMTSGVWPTYPEEISDISLSRWQLASKIA